MTFKKNILGLFFLDILLFFSGYLLLSFVNLNITLSEIIILIICFSAIVFLALYIFHRGINKEAATHTVHILAALSIKILLEMVLALFWFFLGKKTSTSSLLLFFVLYLAFSMFSIYLMLNTLKNKSL